MNDISTRLQMNAKGRLQHLLTLEELPRTEIESLLDAAGAFALTTAKPSQWHGILAGRTVINLFFEPSTRTRISFELAAHRLGAQVVNFDASLSSTRKGESLADTLHTLEAMQVDLFAVRHSAAGAVAELARLAAPSTHIVNAGDGDHAHPTQGLLDLLTIRQSKGRDFSRLAVAIVGDIRHSRVARSAIHGLRALGAGEIRLCGPANLLPDASQLPCDCRATREIEQALRGCDVVITLRLQRERMEDGLVASLDGYFRDFGITPERLTLCQPDVIVMHPGPMNRGVEIADAVADGPHSVILRQVGNGVAVRMAVLKHLLT